jgi:hypothetical protein
MKMENGAMYCIIFFGAKAIGVLSYLFKTLLRRVSLYGFA